jgi:hypothetical protein
MDAVFRYAIDMKLALFWLPFGVRPAHDGVNLMDDGRFIATYGSFSRCRSSPSRLSATREENTCLLYW